MTAVYAWYPNRYNAKDALRMGNYSLLGYVGGNIALEFFFSGPILCSLTCISIVRTQRQVRG
jgi:hypothetical protein